jgi:hypothetical protein
LSGRGREGRWRSTAPEDFLDIIEVSRALNDPRNEGLQVQEPVGTLTLL